MQQHKTMLMANNNNIPGFMITNNMQKITVRGAARSVTQGAKNKSGARHNNPAMVQQQQIMVKRPEGWEPSGQPLRPLHYGDVPPRSVNDGKTTSEVTFRFQVVTSTQPDKVQPHFRVFMEGKEVAIGFLPPEYCEDVKVGMQVVGFAGMVWAGVVGWGCGLGLLRFV